ncbi:MAG TPA: N-acetylmuramoyl-L-alanine amidase [bacterium]|nr:N-acetylmuramoyl-L-alanine amidase [bacterium]
MMRRFVIIVMLLLLLPALAGADSVENQYQKLRGDYQTFLTNIKAQHQRVNWQRYIRAFIQFAEDHPEHARAADALFIAGDGFVRMARWSGRNDDLRAAIKVYDRMARVYPESNLADDALVKAGRILETKLEAPAEAYLRYQGAAGGVGNGDLVAEARAGMERLAAFAPQAPLVVEGTPAPPVESETPPAVESVETTPEPEPPSPSASAQVRSCAVWAGKNHLRLVLVLSAPVTIEQSCTQPAADRHEPGELRLSFIDAALAEDFSLPAMDDSLVQQAEMIDDRNGSVTLRLQLNEFSSYQISRLNDPPRVIVDVQTKHPQALSPSASRKRVIVIDPGHGGDDLGAHNGALVEKDIVLAVALLVKKELSKRSDLVVVLTREEDVYLPLDVRTAIANELAADLFVSLHVNASFRPVSNGIETYMFAGNSQPDDAEIVDFENKAGNHTFASSRNLLNHFYTETAREESRHLAKTMQNKLLARVRTVRKNAADRGTKQAPLMVLMDARMPAVLVEIGFATHTGEAELLPQTSYQQLLADGVVAGIQDYLDRNE